MGKAKFKNPSAEITSVERNIEAIIQAQARDISLRMSEIASWAKTEEDIRHECNKLIDRFIEDAGLHIKGRHEYGLAGGNIDSKYGGVVIEYKKAGILSASPASLGVKKVAEQLVGRFKDFQSIEGVEPDRIFGIGCDARYFVFLRWRGGQPDLEKSAPVSPYTVERLLRAIVSLGARGLSFTSANICSHFGADSSIIQKGIKHIYDVISKTTNVKAKTFFQQWQILFGEVCGYDVRGLNTKVKALGEYYHVPATKPALILFSLHTYYAIFIKLVAAEIVSSFSPIPLSPLKRLSVAPSDEKLKDELLSLERGGIWTQLGIRNFLEGDLFSWYLDAWEPNIAECIRDMVRELDQFDPTTLSVDPLESRDLLKSLYQRLFPKTVRHDLGEYYTPDWLADLVLDEMGYDGNPNKRLLDPACGSGTFLVLAINRVKTWFDENRASCGFGEEELLRLILKNIIGFDLNPLAVMAARTNYLIAIRNLLRYAAGLELPIYLCDSILTPSEYADLFTGAHGKTRKLKTSVEDFIIPNEIALSREVIGKYADMLEFCIRNGYSPEEFLERCRTEGLPTSEERLHRGLYAQIRRLDSVNQNGIWARIIKNAFAPMFIGQVDYVAGNPPWINWENLPEDYRNDMKHLWEKYGLFTLSGFEGRLGGGKKDLSMLFVYSALDNYLGEGGRLGFVITQTVFKTMGAGDGFRRLKFEKDKTFVYIKPVSVHDLSRLQVFEGATNRTAVLVCEKKTKSFSYPVNYTAWRGPGRIPQDATLHEVREPGRLMEYGAIPVNPHKKTSPWLTAPKTALAGIKKVLGKSDYEAYAGCCTWLNGVFWINILEKRKNGDLLIENLYDCGKLKLKQVQAVIEPDLVYPLLRGRDVSRWHAHPSAYIILAQDPNTRAGILEGEMKRKYPRTFAYFKQFEGDPQNPQRGTLRGRSGYRQYFKPTDPFYSIYNVGLYTLAKWKVVWKEQSSFFQSSIISAGRGRPILADHKSMLVPCENEKETNYLSGLLNSAPSVMTIQSYVISVSTSTHVLEHIKIPRYERSSTLHNQIAMIASRCHSSAKNGNQELLNQYEEELDDAAAEIWSIPKIELKAIQETLAELSAASPTAENGDEK